MENKAIARIEQFAKKISESLWNESGTGRAVLTAGENNHKKSAENNQLQSIEYRQ